MSGDSASTSGRERPRDVVVAGLRRRITLGDLRVGDRIPTQAELGSEYGAPRGAVRRALEVLEREGLIKRARQGASAVVAQASSQQLDGRAGARDGERERPWPGVPEGRTLMPRSAGLELSERVARAFRSRQVTIDAYCFNGETLSSALAATVVALHSGERPCPRSVRLRILLPDPDNPLALPQSIDDPQDSRPRERLKKTMNNIFGSLRHSLRMLAMRELVPEVSVEARKVGITPTQRVYILNEEEVLVGHYQVESRRTELDHTPVQIYDLLGLEGMLFRHTAVPGDHLTAVYVRQTQLWFESLWNTVARPLDS